MFHYAVLEALPFADRGFCRHGGDQNCDCRNFGGSASAIAVDDRAINDGACSTKRTTARAICSTSQARWHKA